MAARTLVQALEGVHFPCDRAQLLDYARRNNLGEGTLAVLEEIPERRYQDLGEVFTALPGTAAPRPQPRRQAHAEPRREPELRRDEAEEPPPEEAGPAGENFPPMLAPMEWWMNGWRQMMMPWEMTAQCLRGSLDTWPQWLRLSRHLWFPWSKE